MLNAPRACLRVDDQGRSVRRVTMIDVPASLSARRLLSRAPRLHAAGAHLS